ncbi:hypothetical protein BH20VER1_BH20VER1_23780 [soil metagenome]
MNYSTTPLRFVLALLALSFVPVFTASALVPVADERPAEIDVRGHDGIPKGTALRQPNAAQLKAINSLEARGASQLVIDYNGATATPRHLFSHNGFLTEPSRGEPETIAREFLSRWRAIWRFSDSDLQNLRLRSRATTPDSGTTILLFEQVMDGIPLHKGEVLVNVNSAGQILSVGGESFPGLSVNNGFTLTPTQAVTAAAADVGVDGFIPEARGAKPALRTYGDLPQEMAESWSFSGGEQFTDEINVQKVVFPMGDKGRAAYRFGLTTPQHDGIMWENIVDAETGEVLRRISLTAFQAGGGTGAGRHGTLRPDVQDMLESLNAAGTARGKVFDSMPTALSGALGFGRSPARGVPPTYAPDTTTTAPGRGFRQGFVMRRVSSPLIYDTPFGQVLRGFPDALNPTPESPFGWFYLPTDTGGVEINAANQNRAGTRDFGYTMHTIARDRNPAANSPGGNGQQPFSASLTPLAVPQMLADGRNLTSVFQSHYTEGNNVIVADDHQNDNESTHGIKGYSGNWQFTGDHFTFINSYEYGGVDAASGVFPPSTFPDVPPGTVNLFYMINFLHDYLYSIGFTEPFWNFQQDNFGRGGAGKDAVSGQVQDGSGINNANFGTPADGGRPRMQMFLWTEAAVRRADGDFDFDVVAHELYHGVSNRSAGKGEAGCLGVTLVGESGGQGEGWSDFLAESMSDDDGTGEYVVGNFDRGIRRLPKTNFRYSYASINQRGLTRRDQVLPPDPDTSVGTGSIPFAVHRTGEVWSATLWDMRELLIMKDPAGVFFDGSRRLGGGTPLFIGSRQVNSVDAQHPINYRASFNTQDPGTVVPSAHVVRPVLLSTEIATLGNRSGPLASAVRKGARLADTLVLRGLQLSPCNPSYVNSRDSILLADREMTGGENQAIIWRAFASHGIGQNASSTASGSTDPGSQSAPVVVEDFTVPAGVTQCEQLGPLPPPTFTLTNTIPNAVTVNIPPTPGAATYVISRSSSANGPFTRLAEIPATATAYTDNNGGEGLPVNATFFYQVRVTRNPQCVSTATTQSITVTLGVALQPAPVFFGATTASDPRQGNRLIISWSNATSAEPNANLVYDIYRVSHVDHGTGQNDPTFTPSLANRIAQGVTGTSFTDTGLTLNQVYYYIVQARDTGSGKIDTANNGNRIVRWNAPTISCFIAPTFALEQFESPNANTRFAPPLVESGGTPSQAIMAFQRVTGVVPTGMMYAPDFSPPGSGGAESDFFAAMGPLTLTPTSIMEFDHFFATETNFDGSVIEISVGSPNFNALVFPDNVTTFDLGDYMIEGGYNDKLDGTLAAGVFLSPLQGRRAFTGFKGLHHTRIALRNFAPGGLHNPSGLPVYIRFRMTSDVGTSVGVNTGWYIDNLVINNMGSNGQLDLQEVVSRKAHGEAGTFDIPLPLSGPRGIECRTSGANGNHTLVFKFGAPITGVGSAAVTSGSGTVAGTREGESPQELVVDLTGVSNAQVLTVTLGNVTDACGNTAANISVPLGVLLGDTTNNGAVNSSDVGLTKSHSGQTATTSNFRSDVTVNGAINASDVSVIKSQSGIQLPSATRVEPDGSEATARR